MSLLPRGRGRGDDRSRPRTAGFRLMDVRVTLARAPHGARSAGRACATARPDDRPRCARSRAASHGATRFYADRGSLASAATSSTRPGSREPRGLGRRRARRRARRPRRRLRLVHARRQRRRSASSRVAQAARGRGLGDALVEGAIGWCADRGLRAIDRRHAGSQRRRATDSTSAAASRCRVARPLVPQLVRAMTELAHPVQQGVACGRRARLHRAGGRARAHLGRRPLHAPLPRVLEQELGAPSGRC